VVEENCDNRLIGVQEIPKLISGRGHEMGKFQKGFHTA
jgi:hypothetical protein